MRPRHIMPSIDRCAGFALLFAASVVLPLSTAGAETVAELDRLADASVDEAGGLALAQAQASRGEWLEALATVDRVLTNQPRSANARLLQALYLCRVDDVQGGTVALGKLRRRDYDRTAFDAVTTACSDQDGGDQ